MRFHHGLAALSLASCLLLHPSLAEAFMLGYHVDLTREALRHEGFSEDAINLVVAGNTFTDLYSTPEFFHLIGVDDLVPLKEAISNMAGHLHFDQSFRPELIDKNFRILVKNVREAVSFEHGEAATNPLLAQEIILLELGISLHAVQDFYAHSNWAELGMPKINEIAPDATYFDVVHAHTDDLHNAEGVYKTGLHYPQSSFGLFTHWSVDGKPTPYHADLNKDCAGRAHFDDAYRAAYKATVQWARLFQHVIGDLNDPPFWQNLIEFSEIGAEDSDTVDDVRTFTGFKGTVQFLGLYGGAWKSPDMWSQPEVLFQNLPNTHGIGVLEQLNVSLPLLWSQWEAACEAIGNGVFEGDDMHCDNPDPSTCPVDNVTLSLIHPGLGPDGVVSNVHFNCPAADAALGVCLPDTSGQQIHDDIQWMATEAFASYPVKWIKVAATHIQDGDNGDGWLNVNDEEIGGTSDYYGIWHVTPASGPDQLYAESIIRDQDGSFANWEILKPIWDSAPAAIALEVEESDDVDVFQKIAAAAALTIDGITGQPIVDPFLALGIGEAEDTRMDVSPNGDDLLRMHVDPMSGALSGLPANIQVQLATPYGHLVGTAGNDDNFFGDFTVAAGVQVSLAAPTTKVRIIVLEVTSPSYTAPSKIHCTATINNLKLQNSDTFAVISTATPPVFDAFPNWQRTYEGYIDKSTIPISFQVVDSPEGGGFSIPSGGPLQLTYDMTTGNVAGNGNVIKTGLYDYQFTDDGYSIKFQIRVDNGASAPPPEPQPVAACAPNQSLFAINWKNGNGAIQDRVLERTLDLATLAKTACTSPISGAVIDVVEVAGTTETPVAFDLLDTSTLVWRAPGSTTPGQIRTFLVKYRAPSIPTSQFPPAVAVAGTLASPTGPGSFQDVLSDSVSLSTTLNGGVLQVEHAKANALPGLTIGAVVKSVTVVNGATGQSDTIAVNTDERLWLTHDGPGKNYYAYLEPTPTMKVQQNRLRTVFNWSGTLFPSYVQGPRVAVGYTFTYYPGSSLVPFEVTMPAQNPGLVYNAAFMVGQIQMLTGTWATTFQSWDEQTARTLDPPLVPGSGPLGTTPRWALFSGPRSAAGFVAPVINQIYAQPGYFIVGLGPTPLPYVGTAYETRAYLYFGPSQPAGGSPVDALEAVRGESVTVTVVPLNP